LSLFVDTSVWSLALRRDGPSAAPQVIALVKAIANGEPILTTGLVLQELLTAALRNTCRGHRVQIGTIDAAHEIFSTGHA
jgi:predicted nucleic acid-binding protein